MDESEDHEKESLSRKGSNTKDLVKEAVDISQLIADV
jgi:hypothetical protein